MSGLVQNATLSSTPQLNAMGVIAQSSHDLREVNKTKEVFAQHVKESQETISSKADEIQALKAQVAHLQQLREEEIAALRAELAAEVAKHVADKQADKERIAVLTLRNAIYNINCQTIRTMFFNGELKASFGRKFMSHADRDLVIDLLDRAQTYNL